MLILSVKNEKLNFFNRPIYVESKEEAFSLIQNILISDGEKALSGLRSDLALYQLGSIDFVTGKIDVPKKPIFLSTLESIFDSVPDDILSNDYAKKVDFLIEKYRELNEKIGGKNENS